MHQESLVTTYTKRDIKAADMLAMILVGFGVVIVFFALFKTIGKAGKAGGSVAGTWITAGVFLALGTALNLKVRQLVRTKGVEPVDYDGVPD
jgi:lipopolysaccharide export LptBFGC system permease protein LptF